MASHPLGVGDGVSAHPETTRWIGVHLHYHGDRDRVLAAWVGPAAASLLEAGLARRFFFIRYLLGGPHVRLRVEVNDADAVGARARMHSVASAYVAHEPSTIVVPPERIHRLNAGIIASDPSADESDDVVVPDNSVLDRPVHFEVDRYGGHALFSHSVDLFGISSIETLRVVEENAEANAGRRTAAHMRLLLRQAWGHAAGEEEFVSLADYGGEMFARPLAKLVPAADAAFERGRAGVCALVRAELSALAGIGERPALAEAARALRSELRRLPVDRRYAIGVSHMHMTANRLGLMNPDEVYLSRVLSRAVESVASEDPAFWRDAWHSHRAWTEVCPSSIRELNAAALTDFAGRAVAASTT